MRKITISSIIFLFFFFHHGFGQEQISVTFTAEFNNSHVSLDSIIIENLTQGCDTTLFYPDTVLSIIITEIATPISPKKGSLIITQNFPNPFEHKTYFDVFIPINKLVTINVWDVLGREIAQFSDILASGNNSFAFIPGTERYYILSVRTNDEIRSFKMVNTNTNAAGNGKIIYLGSANNPSTHKSLSSNFKFNQGDYLRYRGFSLHGTIADSDIIEDTLLESDSLTFTYKCGIPCEGSPTVIDIDGNIYNTVQIGHKCWMAENLNTGIMITPLVGGSVQSNNDTIEKFCHSNDSSNCSIYGGLYEWDEMMQYYPSDSGITGTTRGVCPDGWHIPTFLEYNDLVSYLGGLSQTGGKLKEIGYLYWQYPNTGATNESGFSAFPAGLRHFSSILYTGITVQGFVWTSTEETASSAKALDFTFFSSSSTLNAINKPYSCSVRCIKD